MSSNCARVTGKMPCLMRRRPSHQAAAKPARYISPYHRTASGPTWNAIGSMSGWASTLALRHLPRLRDEFRRRGIDAGASPGEPQLERRVPVGELAVDDAAPAEVRDRARNDCYAQSARDQAHYGLHLYRFLGHVEGKARARGEPADDIVQARRDFARHHDEALAGELAHCHPATRRGKAVPSRERGDEALALHDEMVELLHLRHRRQEQPEVELAGSERKRLV